MATHGTPTARSAILSSVAPEKTQSTQLLVTPLFGPSFPLIVPHHISAAALSRQLAERSGIPTSKFRLLFRGRYADTTLGHLHHDEMIRMVLRAPLRGGMGAKSGYLTWAPDGSHEAAADRCDAPVLKCCHQLFSRRYFFVLGQSKLEWFTDDESINDPKGCVRLAGARVEFAHDALVIVSPGRRLMLRGDDLSEWETAIRAQIEKMDQASGKPSSDGAALVGKLPAEIHRALSAFDDRLAGALRAAIIRLLRAEWLLAQPEDFKLPYRQQLEELEKSGTSPSPLLSPEEAVALLLQGDRSLGAVTHGWLSPGDPDPAGRRMKLLRRVLKERRYIVAIFFECAPLIEQATLCTTCELIVSMLCAALAPSTSTLPAHFERSRSRTFSAAPSA